MAWTTAADIAEYLGATVDVADPYLARCADGANDFCYRRRLEAGYRDDADVAPSAAVALGATMYGGVLYRERGSADSFASFDETAAYAQVGAWPRIKQLLGVGRGQVDTPLTDVLTVNPLRGQRRLF